MRKLKPLSTVGGNVKWYSHYKNQDGGFSKNVKIKFPYDPTIQLLKILLSKEFKAEFQQNICTLKYFIWGTYMRYLE